MNQKISITVGVCCTNLKQSYQVYFMLIFYMNKLIISFCMKNDTYQATYGTIRGSPTGRSHQELGLESIKSVHWLRKLCCVCL